MREAEEMNALPLVVWVVAVISGNFTGSRRHIFKQKQ